MKNITDIYHQTNKHQQTDEAVNHFYSYIAGQVLAERIELVDHIEDNDAKEIDIDDISTYIKISKYAQ